MLRKIVRIDEEKCDGCGQCVPSCAEGAIDVVGGKARLSADVLCDGLGACLGECPRGAITVEEREAPAFDEDAVKRHLLSMGTQVASRQAGPLAAAAPPPPPAARAPARPRLGLAVVSDAAPAAGGGCPGSRPMVLAREPARAAPGAAPASGTSRLAQWPVQLHLVPVRAPYFAGADLLVAADCVPFAHARFHDDLLAGKALVVGCPKLDDVRAYADKLREIFASNDVRSVTVARMEVPCCGGLTATARRSLEASGKAATVPLRDVVVAVDGSVR